jgi:glycosyltransferase involved in cell wall biosynthesis
MRLTYGVVTATLNARASLARSLSSTLTQSRAPDEVVVIDGGSSDGSTELAEEILAETRSTRPPVHGPNAYRTMRQQGTGIANAWNEAIDALASDVVFLVNADDALEPGAAETAMNAFERDPEVDIVHGNARFVAADGRALGIVRPGVFARLGVRCRTMHCATMVRRRVYDRLGAFDGSYRTALDFDFIERCHRAGVRFLHLDTTLATFSLGGVSNTRLALADREMLEIGLRHSRTKILPLAAFLARRALLRPMRLAGFDLWSRAEPNPS